MTYHLLVVCSYLLNVDILARLLLGESQAHDRCSIVGGTDSYSILIVELQIIPLFLRGVKGHIVKEFLVFDGGLRHKLEICYWTTLTILNAKVSFYMIFSQAWLVASLAGVVGVCQEHVCYGHFQLLLTNLLLHENRQLHGTHWFDIAALLTELFV